MSNDRSQRSFSQARKGLLTQTWIKNSVETGTRRQNGTQNSLNTDKIRALFQLRSELSQFLKYSVAVGYREFRRRTPSYIGFDRNSGFDELADRAIGDNLAS